MVGWFNRKPSNPGDPGCIFLAELHLYRGAVFNHGSHAANGALRRFLRAHPPPRDGGSRRRNYT
jgi:hypothetical protein